VIDEIEERGLAASVTDVGSYLRKEIKALTDNVPNAADVRGHGLFVGIEWVSDPQSKVADREGAVRVVNLMKDRGFLMSNAGALGNVVKIRPPLVFSRDNADAFLQAFADTMRQVSV